MFKLYAPEPGRFDRSWFRGIFAHDSRVGIDTEYTGGGMYAPGASLRLVQFGTETAGVTLDMRDDAQRQAAYELVSEDRVLVCHGAISAEVPAISIGLGVDISDKVYDTLVPALLVFPGEAEAHGLKDFASQLGDAGHALLAAEEELKAEFKRLWLVDHKHGKAADIETFGWTYVDQRHPAYLRYAALDAIVVRRFAPLIAGLARQRGVHGVIDFEQSVNASAARQSLRGWQVDTSRRAHLLRTVGADNAAAQREFESTYSVKARSPKRALVLAEQGVEFRVFNAVTQAGTRSPKLSKEVLVELAAEYPQSHAVATLLRHAETANVTTFLTSLGASLDGNARVHPGIRTLGAVTGRWTVAGGIQTASGSSGARSVFVPRDEDHVIVSIDLGQIEPRVQFELSSCLDLIELCRQGVDPYAAAATMVFGASFTSKQRKVAKRIVLGSMFGAGIDTLLRQAIYTDGIHDITRDAIKSAREQFNRSVPQIQATSKRLQQEPEIRLPSGRVVPQDPDRLYRAINSYTQGPARDFLMELMLAVEDAGLGRYLLLAMHDELLLDIPRAELVDAVTTLQKIFTRGYGRVPTTCDVEIFDQHWAGRGIAWDEYLTGSRQAVLL